jgi:hypothetical protein
MLWPTVSRPVYLGVKHPSGAQDQIFFCQTVAGLLMWGVLFDERTDLSFTIAAGPRQHCHYPVRVPQDSWPYFTVSVSRLPQPRGPGPRIYIPQEQGRPAIPPGTEFPFRSLLRLSTFYGTRRFVALFPKKLPAGQFSSTVPQCLPHRIFRGGQN